ncbi:putative set domain-containing protein [Erysiphe neolycopersici]|uniref:Putative set domain-containing protein n=1 Tax=Erysiphe neolycopersici TaxID=212602 RepID=A0A420I3Z7_9PEZI|nr:putative set domain-containing protein [Erysiphe neolycopersici]
MVETQFIETVSSPTDSTERRVILRRETSSGSTISAHSYFDYPYTCSSTPPTYIGENISEFSSSGKGNLLTSFSSECLNTGICNEPSTLKASLRCESSTFKPTKLAEDYAQHDLTEYIREDSRNEIFDNTVNIFQYVDRHKKNSRRSIRLARKSLKSVAYQKEHNSHICELQEMGIKFFMGQKEKLRTEDRRSTRNSNKSIELIAENPQKIEKSSFKRVENNLCVSAPISRELRNLTDTLEYAKIDVEPIIHEIWSNGKLVTDDCPQKNGKLQGVKFVSQILNEPTILHRTNYRDRERKLWLTEGLYAGQESCSDWYEYPSDNKRRKTRSFATKKPNKVLPLPMWHGKRLIEAGRDFKLPFDICSPLPPGQPKPDEWRKTTKNRFVGEAGILWKVSKFLDCTSSKCVCIPTTGCDENCQNRIMFYECDNSNCASGPDSCTNRPFAALQERRKAGGKYRVGVEVIKTVDRGYGVRSTRCFEPNQIIVEYTGEIITEEECDRRMREDYKNNDCHYLMSFDQSMIIDATKGSIACFVNHSCNPNCRMVKWIVGGNPRLALFAGDKPIMTGDELTYDYNFDPFSTKNIQKCRCGTENCRGVLGPRPKDLKICKEKDNFKVFFKDAIAGRKRKIKEVKENHDDLDGAIQKKRKTGHGTVCSVSCSSASKKNAKSSNKNTRDMIFKIGKLKSNTIPNEKNTNRRNPSHVGISRDQDSAVSKQDAKSVTVSRAMPNRRLRRPKSKKMPSNPGEHKILQKLVINKNTCGSKKKKIF